MWRHAVFDHCNIAFPAGQDWLQYSRIAATQKYIQCDLRPRITQHITVEKLRAAAEFKTCSVPYIYYMYIIYVRSKGVESQLVPSAVERQDMCGF